MNLPILYIVQGGWTSDDGSAVLRTITITDDEEDAYITLCEERGAFANSPEGWANYQQIPLCHDVRDQP